MKLRTFIAANLVLVLAGTLAVQAQTKLSARSGSKMRVEGTSNIHDWQVEGKLIGGNLEVGKEFPLEPGAKVNPGKVEAKGEVFVPVRSLTSIEKDGRPYSTKMDDIMYEKLLADTHKRIAFRLSELTLKEAAKDKESPYVFEAKGDVMVAGVTNQVTMPVNVLPMADGKIKISGKAELKMSDFKIEPPAPKIGLGLIKTGDPVIVIFDWMVGAAKPAADAK
jgi:hypothetical protein